MGKITNYQKNRTVKKKSTFNLNYMFKQREKFYLHDRLLT